jgi:ATP-dependent exoDNAse (exonuclease V) alpha subunit
MKDIQISSDETDKMFCYYTNYLAEVVLKKGARVMFLNNSLFEKGLFNGSVGVILQIVDENIVKVAFPLKIGIAIVFVKKDTSYFRVNGIRSHRIQFPLQNAFALTVHKTQELTLPHITVSLDESIFADGQAYVALSRAPSWESIEITSFNEMSIKADTKVIAEYQRLEEKYNNGIMEFYRKLNQSS